MTINYSDMQSFAVSYYNLQQVVCHGTSKSPSNCFQFTFRIAEINNFTKFRMLVVLSVFAPLTPCPSIAQPVSLHNNKLKHIQIRFRLQTVHNFLER